MAKTNIGRVSVVPKGEYSSIENYKRLDVVSSDGSMYISKKDNNIGNPLTDKNWWFKAVEKGEVGAQGEKPVNGVDYNTEEEKEEFKNDVVNKATEEVKKNISDTESEAIKNYNDNATRKTTEYNTNANRKLTAYNDNVTQKTEEYNSNATSKVSEYNTNASTQIETFNNNATNKTNTFDENATIKTNAFNDNYDEKMQAINEASTSIEAERKISDSKYACALKTQVKDAQQAQIYAENEKVEKLKIKGVELTQNTREGYNFLINNFESQTIKGVEFTVQEDKSILANGTATENIVINLLDGVEGANNTGSNILEIPSDVTNIMLSGCPSGGSSSTYKIDLWAENGNLLYGSDFGNGLKISLTQNENWRRIKRARIVIYSGTILDNLIFKPMIISGTESKPYEQYGIKPSLDFPSEVQATSGQNIQIAKNNLFNILDITNFSNATISDGIIISSPRNNYGWMKIIENIFLIKSVVYISFDVRIQSGTVNSINRASFNDSLTDSKELTKVGSTSISSNWTRIKFKTELNDNYNLQNIWLQVGEAESAILEIKNIMISYNDLDYEDYYNVNNIAISLINSAIGQYTDTIDRENNVQNKIIEKVSFNGYEDWTYNQPENKFMCSIPRGIKIKDISLPQLCTHYKIKSDFASNENEFACTVNGFRFHNDNNMTIEKWKTFLEQQNQAGTPLTVYYIAETSTPEPLSEEVKQELDKFKLYDNLNNVFIDNGSLSFIYNKSLLRAFKEQSELSANLLERVQALEQAQVNQVGGN